MRISRMASFLVLRSLSRRFCSRFGATEFRRHREVTNPVHVMGFLTQWKMYLDGLPQDPSAENFKKLDPTLFEKVKHCMHSRWWRFFTGLVCNPLDVRRAVGSVIRAHACVERYLEARRWRWTRPGTCQIMMFIHDTVSYTFGLATESQERSIWIIHNPRLRLS